MHHHKRPRTSFFIFTQPDAPNHYPLLIRAPSIPHICIFSQFPHRIVTGWKKVRPPMWWLQPVAAHLLPRALCMGQGFQKRFLEYLSNFCFVAKECRPHRYTQRNGIRQKHRRNTRCISVNSNYITFIFIGQIQDMWFWVLDWISQQYCLPSLSSTPNIARGSTCM